MPEQSGFASAVGGFMQGFGTVKDFQRQAAEERRRQKESERADQFRRVQLDEKGYTETQMPTIDAPKGFLARIGERLSGGPEAPESVLIKDHQSIAEKDQATQFAEADRVRNVGAALTREGWGRDDARTDKTIAAENQRSANSNRTQLGVANIYASRTAAAQEREGQESVISQREKFVNEMLAASDGNPTQAMRNVESRPSLKKEAQRLALTRFHYFAGSTQYAERPAAQLAHDRAARAKEAYDKSYAGIKEALERPSRVTDGNGSQNSGARQALSARDRQMAERDPGFRETLLKQGYSAEELTQNESDADMWERLVRGGMPEAQATQTVRNRKR